MYMHVLVWNLKYWNVPCLLVRMIQWNELCLKRCERPGISPSWKVMLIKGLGGGAAYSIKRQITQQKVFFLSVKMNFCIFKCRTKWSLDVEVSLFTQSRLNPKHLNRHLVAGCSTGHKSFLLHVNGWEMDNTEKVASVVLGSSYHTEVCLKPFFGMSCRGSLETTFIFKYVFFKCLHSQQQWILRRIQVRGGAAGRNRK